MQSCSLCGSGPFNKGQFKEHELTQKHLKAFKAQQEQASSLQQCHVCGSGSFTKQCYEQHCLTQKHLKAAQQKEQESQRLKRQTAAIAAAVCEEREDQIPAIIAEYAALAAHQEETSSSSYVCAVCAGSSFASKQNYERHCLSQKHLKALAAQQEEAAACKEREGHIAASIAQTQQEEAVACKEREDHIAASIAQNVA